MWVNGKMEKCMEKENIFGMMGENILGLINKIKNKDLVSIFGMMEDCMKGFGKMENSMEKGCLKIKKIK